MPDTFQLEIATPDRLLLNEQVNEAQIPALNGYIGVFPEHAPLVSALGTGVLSFSINKQRHDLAVSGGFVEVLPDHVRVLADRAENSGEIDIERAQAALLRAEERLSKLPQDTDIARALNALQRAQCRLAAANKQPRH